MKKSKLPISVILAGVAGVLCIIVYAVLEVYARRIPDEIIYPQPGVSDSIFELQNMNYEEVGGFTEKIMFEEISLAADAVPGVEAKVGGATIRTDNGYYFLYALIDKNKTTEELLGDSLTEIISPSADSSQTASRLLDSEDGNLHGCHASYGLFEITAGDGAKGWITLYRLHMDETFGETDKDIILGCMSGDYSTQGLANLQAFSRAMVGTLHIEIKEE